jgi:purine-nucleoside phosphorylase
VNTLQRINESVAYIHKLVGINPVAGIILGTGLGGFISDFEIETRIPYSDIPHFPVSGVEGHEGALLFGKSGNCSVVIMQGRVHYYEGYPMSDIIYPIRVLSYLGIHALLISNAAGGLNPQFKTGDLMIITDHINLMPNPLIGKHEDDFGERFPDMSQAYDPALIDRAGKIAQDLDSQLHTGCYVAVTGPTYETPSEYNYFRLIGGDAVGMSTVPEVIAAHQMQVRCFAISVITDLGIPGKPEYLTHKKVQEVAEASLPDLSKIFRALLREIEK